MPPASTRLPRPCLRRRHLPLQLLLTPQASSPSSLSPRSTTPASRRLPSPLSRRATLPSAASLPLLRPRALSSRTSFSRPPTPTRRWALTSSIPPGTPLPLIPKRRSRWFLLRVRLLPPLVRVRSEEHTSELQSPDHLVCR